MRIDSINAGIIGTGHLGKIHCKLLKEISECNKLINFVGIFEKDESVKQEVANEYRVRAFDTFEDMINEINALIIVTPTTTHFEIAKQAAQKGINLFIEKPVTSELDQANRLMEFEKNIKIQIGHVERFNPALIALENHNIQPMFIETHRLAQFNPRGTDVSVIQDLMIHDIDIILHLVNSPLTKVDANGVSVISDAIDIANARLQFENGCTANITASRISLKKMRKMRIFQKNAYISIDFLNNKSEIFRLAQKSEIKPDTQTLPLGEDKYIIFEQPGEPSYKTNNPIKNELESFFNSLLNDTPVKITLSEGKEALETAEKIMKIIAANPKII